MLAVDPVSELGCVWGCGVWMEWGWGWGHQVNKKIMSF